MWAHPHWWAPGPFMPRLWLPCLAPAPGNCPLHTPGSPALLAPAALLSQQMSRWLKLPIRMRTCKCDSSCMWSKKTSSTGSWSGGLDVHHQVSFVGPVLDFYPQALNLFTAVTQRQLFTIYPLLNIGWKAPGPLPSLSLLKGLWASVAMLWSNMTTHPTMFLWGQSGCSPLIAPWFPSHPVGYPCSVHWCNWAVELFVFWEEPSPIPLGWFLAFPCFRAVFSWFLTDTW